MKKGAIDIGTNSIRMLIADVEVDIDQQIIKSRSKFIRSTRMGEGVNQTNNLSESAIDRSVAGLKELLAIAHKKGVHHLPIMATSAVRDAKNKNVFLNRVKDELGVCIQVIDGDREAELGFKGVLKGLGQHKNLLVIDIGGGSTEFVYGDQSGIFYKKSMQVGAVRMTEKCIHEPITNTQMQCMIKEIEKVLMPVLEHIKKFPINQVVGIGGTVTTMASVHKRMDEYDPDKIHNSILKKEDIENILDLFRSKTLEERKKIIGLQPKRADVIVAGTQILQYILDNLNIQEVIVSEYDNLEGMLMK